MPLQVGPPPWYSSSDMVIRQRFVNFGTAFSAREGELRTTGTEIPVESLLGNEIAVDVGSTCWGWLRPGTAKEEELRVIDHHFDRGDQQYPSACAAVLDLQERIVQWVDAMPHSAESIWIVSHQEPDYDALCAMTLVEDIVFQGGSVPARPLGSWFDPGLDQIEPRYRWRYQLAAIASLTDQCKRQNAPKNRTLPAMLYACGRRGMSFTDSGFRRSFFSIVRRELASGRNALTDSVLEHAPEFQLEREFLDRQDRAYARDIARARRVVVNIPTDPALMERYADLKTRPLLDERGLLNPEQIPLQSGTTPVDAALLRDPECLLFKELARQDLDHSPSGRGFTFTAVAYSGVKGHTTNHSDYFFSLNPESILGAHLYPVWAHLQEAEVKARISAKQPGGPARPEYAERSSGDSSGQFQDPWFDGATYRCTLVVAPGSGTWIGPPGHQADLSDDPVVRIVMDYFEFAQWTGQQILEDFCASSGCTPSAQTDLVLSDPRPLIDQTYRFVAIALRSGTKLFASNLGSMIARRLWRTLSPNADGIPLDFDDHHVVILGAATGCWSRYGLAVAYHDNDEGQRVRNRLRSVVQAMAQLACEISEITANEKRDVNHLRVLLHRVAHVKWQVAQPDVKLAQRFFDAIGFEKELSLVHELYHAEASHDNLRDIAALQRSAGVLEIMVLGVYALEAAHLFASGAHEAHFGLALAYVIGAPVAIGAATAYLHLTEAKSRHSAESPRRGELLLLGSLFILLFVLGGWLSVVSHQESEKHNLERIEEQMRLDNEQQRRQAQRELQWRERFDKLERHLGIVEQRLLNQGASSSGRVPKSAQ